MDLLADFPASFVKSWNMLPGSTCLNPGPYHSINNAQQSESSDVNLLGRSSVLSHVKTRVVGPAHDS